MTPDRSVRRGHKRLGLLVAVALGALAPLGNPAAARAADPPAGTAYYVDSGYGNDSASGTSPDKAWRSLAQVNRTTFRPGDRILLKAGGSWQGQLWPKGSGEEHRPIVIGDYGKGPKPRIQGEGRVDDAVRLFNQEYWEIRDLDVSNAVPATGTPGENLRDLRGVHVSGDDSRRLDHFVIERVDVHDVTGEVNWISGSVSNNAPGIRFKTGWDSSKKTGGIVFDTTVPDITAPPAAPTVLGDIQVRHSTVRNTSFAGIVVKQYTGDGKDENGNTIARPTGWGTRTSAADTTFTPHTNVTIRDNYITQAGTAYGCNGVYLTNARGALVDHNVVDATGTSGIETYYSDDVVIQRNEVYRTQQKAGGADSNGIDADKGTTRVLIQYNFVTTSSAETPGTPSICTPTGRPRRRSTTAPCTTRRDPAVSGPYGTAATGPQLKTALGFAPAKRSPLIDSGAATPDNGGRDYIGTRLYRGAPDTGAVEYRR